MGISVQTRGWCQTLIRPRWSGAAGVNPDEIEFLLLDFKVPKLTEEREIDFDQLKAEMLELMQVWRLEAGGRPIEMKF